MNIDERIKTLETEFQATREEIKQILLDIRIYLMESGSPFQSDSGREASAKDEEKGVAPNGNG